MSIQQTLKEEFKKIFGTTEQARYYFAPGRVNLIGEHTDYNGGLVFPCAIDKGTYIAVKPIEKPEIQLNSLLFSGSKTIQISEIETIEKFTEKQDYWMNYVLGVIIQFLKKNIKISGFQLLTTGNLPTGAGLSSSASIELAVGFALNNLFNKDAFPVVELVKMAQSAEREYVGVSCGIMDQFAIGMAEEKTAIKLQCDTLQYDIVPLQFDNYQLVVTNTNKARELAGSKYNERVAECQKSIEIINQQLKDKKITTLGDLTLTEFQKIDASVFDTVQYKRVKHVITEIERVRRAVDALKKNNFVLFGQLMNESHDSLEHDYEVSCHELDVLVHESRKIPGVLGSRMTGAGFGGCTVSLVQTSLIEKYKEQISKIYTEKTGLQAEFYSFNVSDGVKQLFDSEKKQQIVVTGGTGYIGSHTVVELQEAGFEAIIIDNLYNSSAEVIDGIEKITKIRPHFEQVDLTDREATFNAFRKYDNIVGIIHFAAYKAIGESFQKPLKYYENNINSMLNVMRAMQEFNINTLVFSSSCAVYGKAEKLPVTENSPFLPAESPYGNTKQIGEQMLQNFVRSELNKKVLSLRYFNPIGAHESLHIGECPIGVPLNLVPYVTQTAFGIREKLSVFGGDWETPDGSCIRDYLHVVDLAKAHIVGLQRILKCKNPEESYQYFNLGKGKGYSVLEIIKTFEKVTGVKINYQITDRRAGDIAEIWAENTKALNVLGWKPEKSLEEMLSSAWEWEKAYREAHGMQAKTQ